MSSKGEEGLNVINVGHKDLCQPKQKKNADSTVKAKKKKHQRVHQIPRLGYEDKEW